jgi:exonuclease III
VYIAYNPSGARWETDKKTYSHRLFEAVNQDLQQRGDITAIFCGDFNLTIEDSEILQRWYKHGPWFDSHMSLAHPTPEIMRPAIRVKVLE